ncbi:MAG: hypothetical protein IPP79_21180 [Chitinophagaceae bacterium]|nr:hypothetical protein [Chitinophagaceae bacterium]
MYTHYKIWAKESRSFLDPALAAKLRTAKTGDVVIVAAGETIEDIGQGVAWLEDIVIHDACYALSQKCIQTMYHICKQIFFTRK